MKETDDSDYSDSADLKDYQMRRSQTVNTQYKPPIMIPPKLSVGLRPSSVEPKQSRDELFSLTDREEVDVFVP